MKTMLNGLTLVAIGILASCGGSGSSSSGSSKPLASITINASNADSVAKGAVSSQAVADTGSTSTNTVKSATLITDSTQSYSALSLAMKHLRMAEKLPIPTNIGTRAITSTSYFCNDGTVAPISTTANTYTYTFDDADSSGTFSSGDTFSISYYSCIFPSTTITLAGSTYLALNSYRSSATTPPTPSDPDSGSITLSYNNFSITDSTPSTGVTISFDGSMTMSYSDNGTLFTASMTGTSFTATVSGIGSITYTNFTFTSTETSSTETFYVDMSISMTPTGGTTGTVNISTPVTFSGPVGGNPTSGQMRIDGANGSYMTITANNDNTVTIVIFDGTTTTTKTKAWDAI